MIEIIPNWHPFFVHFTVALLSLAVVFYPLARVLPGGRLRDQWGVVARWNLWLGSGFAVVSAIAGWLAYNSVMHDDLSHAAMVTHRNWALTTLALFVMLSAWSVWRYRTGKEPGRLFLVLLVAGGALLLSTAWHGSELVYRHGLGVLSLPQPEQHGENHNHIQEGHAHGAGQDKPDEPEASQIKKPAAGPATDHHHDHSNHTH